MFLGGVTFSEVSVLRWLSQRPGAGMRFLVGTTKLVNGRTMLQSFLDPSAPLPKAAGDEFRI
jgi:hypothetical protein